MNFLARINFEESLDNEVPQTFCRHDPKFLKKSFVMIDGSDLSMKFLARINFEES
jgi:hypothetical protein